MQNEKNLQRLLRRQGYRLTGQRQVVLDVLQREPGLLTAEAIFNKARQSSPNINLATVYRTLTLLKRAGLVEQSYISPDHHEAGFSLTILDKHHDDEATITTEFVDRTTSQNRFHFRCLGCGQIIQFHNSAILDALRDTLNLNNEQLEQVCMCVQGYCTECSKQRPHTPEKNI